MKIEFRIVEVIKKRPLRISRGVSGNAKNAFVFVSENGLTGIGEMCGIAYDGQTSETCSKDLEVVIPLLESVSPNSVWEVEKICRSQEIGSATTAAINIACWDWVGKKSGLALWKHLGLSKNVPETSVTVGINELDVIAEQTEQILADTNAQCLKQKLGGEGGIEADKERYLIAQKYARGIRHRVDANGGWSVSDAIKMSDWLAQNGCEYLEQPLSHLEPEGLPELFANRKLPIFLDEFIKDSKDVAKYASVCDGINLKLMKCGGISEGIRVVHTARAHGLKTMIGCFGESSVAISAGAHIGCLFDFIDLDSHLNLNPDPATGLGFDSGYLLLSDAAGLGVEIRA